MVFYNELKTHLEAGVSAIYVESSEWMRFRAKIIECCQDTDKKLYFWNPMDGLQKFNGNNSGEHKDFMEILSWLNKDMDNDTVCVLEMADSYLKDSGIVAMFAAVLRTIRNKKSHVIMLSPMLELPKILEKEFSVLDFALPGRYDIGILLNNIKDKHGIHCDNATPILDAVRGLGTTEIYNAFSKVAVNCKKITAEEIPHLVKEKEQIIRKSGYLNFIRTDDKMDSVGGLECLKKWLHLRKNVFGEKARDAKLNAPKGVLLLGIPGTGKSLCAKAVAREWQMPLLRLDMGSIFSSGVGDSEANMRNAIKVAEGLEPCVLWIDEIEKGISGGAGASGELDGGTSVRVFGSLLTWMQEKKKEVFIFATANNISRLPSEMLRKGRFDEIFFVDLPNDEARKNIFNIHLKNKEQETKVTDELIKKTNGFSGSEIEAIVNEALFMSYENEKTPIISVQNLLDATEGIIPLSTTMKENISNLRQWAKNRCRMADEGTPPSINVSNDNVRLPMENENWFIVKEENDK